MGKYSSNKLSKKVLWVIIFAIIIFVVLPSCSKKADEKIGYEFTENSNKEAWVLTPLMYSSTIVKMSQVDSLFEDEKNFNLFEDIEAPNSDIMKKIEQSSDDEIKEMVKSFYTISMPGETNIAAIVDLESLNKILGLLIKKIGSEDLTYINNDELMFLQKVFPDGWIESKNNYDDFRKCAKYLYEYSLKNSEYPDSFLF